MKRISFCIIERPCRPDCPDRNAYCHGKCEKYLAFERQNHARLKEKQKQVEIDSVLLDGRRRMNNKHDKLKKYQGGKNE